MKSTRSLLNTASSGSGGTGEKGDRGPKGDAGPVGNTGPAGVDGIGIQGDTGPQGNTGPAGPQGIQGDTGPAGPQGDTGPAGGSDGTAGPDLTLTGNLVANTLTTISGAPSIKVRDTTQVSGAQTWLVTAAAGTLRVSATSDSGANVSRDAIAIQRTAGAVTSISFGNATSGNNPLFRFLGTGATTFGSSISVSGSVTATSGSFSGGTVTAATFSGSGSSLTGLDASQMTVGTLTSTIFPATVTASISGNLSGSSVLLSGPTTVGATYPLKITAGSNRYWVMNANHAGLGAIVPMMTSGDLAMMAYGQNTQGGNVSATIAITAPAGKRVGLRLDKNAQSELASSDKLTLTSNLVYVTGNLGVGLGASSTYQLDLSTDDARKLTTSTWATGSDARVKSNVQPADLDLCYDTVKNVPLRRFEWDPAQYPAARDRRCVGWLAQEVEAVFPKAVTTSAERGFGNFRTLNSDQMYKAMWGALQRTQQRLEDLEAHLGLTPSSRAPVPYAAPDPVAPEDLPVDVAPADNLPVDVAPE